MVEWGAEVSREAEEQVENQAMEYYAKDSIMYVSIIKKHERGGGEGGTHSTHGCLDVPCNERAGRNGSTQQNGRNRRKVNNQSPTNQQVEAKNG